MKYNPEKHHRRSIRLKGYDYSQSGWYFVTICTQKREILFGDVVIGTMKLNDAGEMVKSIWNEIPKYYPGINIDDYQIMPNHLHGIIHIIGTGPVGIDPRVYPDKINMDKSLGKHRDLPQQSQEITESKGQSQGIAPTISLPTVVQRFKSLTTNRYIDGVNQKGWQPFNGKLWQRNYYEHIIRNEDELIQIRNYIIDNPLKWTMDKYYI
ncbi:MAG: transposase [Calditrichaceae bacterium]|nr:transposase [Calditrichaceae bacterium]